LKKDGNKNYNAPMSMEYSQQGFLNHLVMALAASAMLAGSMGCSAQSVSGRRDLGRPNIVFILADDMGFGDVGCYNPESKIPTPNMDRLAAEGIRFTDCHTPSSICTPTRYALLTGRYSWRTAMKQGHLSSFARGLMDPERPTVATVLRDAGYATACVGKWHLGLDWVTKDGVELPMLKGFEAQAKAKMGWNIDYTKPIRKGPVDIGFDYFYGISATLNAPPFCFIENDRTDGIPDVPKDPINSPQNEGPMIAGWRDEDLGPILTRKAVELVEQYAADSARKPFFLYLALSAPHRPCTPPDFIKGRSKAGLRGDMVAEVDWSVGEVKAAVDRLGLTDNTLFIVTSDNGAVAGDYKNPDTYGHKSNGDWRGYKAEIFEGGHRVPFIARWPGHISAGSVSRETISLVDLTATCAALVGTELPHDVAEDSYNILPALLGESTDGPIREATVHHDYWGRFAIRQGDWVLVLPLAEATQPWTLKVQKFDYPAELYNLATDPKQTRNLAKSEPKRVAQLTALLEKYQREGRSRP